MSQTAESRRTYQREYARKRRDRALAAANATSHVCQRRQGAGTCGARLEDVVDRATGRSLVVCPACERRRRGICRDCPRPVDGQVGTALRCAACKRRAQTENAARYSVRNRETVNRRQRDRLRQLPSEERARKLAYKRMWRRANPEKISRYRKEEAVRRREKIKAYHKARRARLREEITAKARAYYHATTPAPVLPPCGKCGAAIPYVPPGRPRTRCDECVPPCLRARRRRDAGTWTRPSPERPLRTCVTPGCDIVVTHRAKKCTKCKAKHTAMARTLLNAQSTLHHRSGRAA